MNMCRLLEEDNIIMDLQANTKEGIIEEMLDMLVRNGKVKDRASALKAILDRERKMSTGMQHGIAIPHGKTDSVAGAKLVTALALKKTGVDFGALDGKPSTIFIMTLSPINRTGPHIQFLAEMSQILNDPVKRESILKTTTASEVIALLSA